MRQQVRDQSQAALTSVTDQSARPSPPLSSGDVRGAVVNNGEGGRGGEGVFDSRVSISPPPLSTYLPFDKLMPKVLLKKDFKLKTETFFLEA